MDAKVHLALARGHAEGGRFAEALQEIDNAVDAGESEFDCYTAKAATLRSMGDLDAAIAEYIRALHSARASDEEASSLYELGDTYEIRGRGEQQALIYFRRLERLKPGYHDTRGCVVDRILRLTSTEPPDDIA